MLNFSPFVPTRMASILKKHHCGMLEMGIHFDSADFKIDEFIKDVGSSDPDQRAFQYSFGSRVKSRNEHAHFFIGLELPGEDSFVEVAFHPGKNPNPDVRDPYMEDMPAWLGGFFTTELVNVRFRAGFDFKKGYAPTVLMDYPLLVNSKAYEGATVVGYEIDVPINESYVYKTILRKTGDSITVIVQARALVNLSTFDVHDAVKVFSEYAHPFVKKNEDDYGK